ncbi:MAG: hypothetical protein ACJ8LG_20550 [Massilia sp.]
MSKTLLALALALAFVPASAKDFEVNGRGSVPIASGNPQTVRALSFAAAKRNAILAGITRVNGPEAARDGKVVDKLGAILDLVGDDQFLNQRSQSVGDNYETSLTLSMDDKEFKKLLSDNGIALNTSTNRSFSILAVMDEFFTTPTDLKAPLEELEEFSHEKGSSFKDKSIDARSSKAASASSSSSAAAVDARASSSGKASGSHDSRFDASGKASIAGSAQDGYGSASIAGSRSGSVSARDKGEFSGEYKQAGSFQAASASKSSSASASSSSAVAAKNVAAEDHDNVHYKKLIKYQPQNRGPEKTSLTYNALKGQMQDYDLKVLDNDLFRSKYFKNKPITIEQMQQSEDLAKYVKFARADAKADFFMVGSSIIIDSGRNQSTGEFICTGVMTLKTYSTVSGEDIASETTSETASGINANDCAGMLAKKLAVTGGAVVSSRVQDYWKRRNAYGREFVITLQGSALPDSATRGLSRAIKAIEGVEKATLRSQTDNEYQLVVVYKGESLKDELDDKLDTNPAFAARRSRVEADQITICMSTCGPAPAPAAAKGKKK